jgi:transposase
MIEALIAGERDAQALADLARARMRAKIPALQQALAGRFTDHHGFLCRTVMDRIDAITATVDAVTARIEVEIQPFQTEVIRLSTIPGIGIRQAQVILAEIGTDMARFPTARHLASWAGMCPGNHESAGKHHGGATRNGDSLLRGALGEAAASAARTRNTYLQARYRRLAARRGKKRALVAIGHSLLIAIWHMISLDIDYRDLGAEHYLSRADPVRQARRLVSQLHQLGYQAVVTPVR